MLETTRSDFETAVLRRLDQIVLLLLASADDRALGPTEAISALAKLGLTPPEIAKVTGKSSDYVHSILRRKRAPTAKKRTR